MVTSLPIVCWELEDLLKNGTQKHSNIDRSTTFLIQGSCPKLESQSLYCSLSSVQDGSVVYYTT